MYATNFTTSSARSQILSDGTRNFYEDAPSPDFSGLREHANSHSILLGLLGDFFWMLTGVYDFLYLGKDCFSQTRLEILDTKSRSSPNGTFEGLDIYGTHVTGMLLRSMT